VAGGLEFDRFSKMMMGRFGFATRSIDIEWRKAKSLMRYKREEGIANFKSVEGKEKVYFMSAIQDAKGELWMATYGEGVYWFDGKKVTRYPVMSGDKVITVFAIYQNNQGDLWLGTHEHGALKFNGKGFERFRLK
jgi:Two component regulator propeller